jgi:hypothetical protein
MTYPSTDIDSHPIAIFNIKYRSRGGFFGACNRTPATALKLLTDSLHAEMIIPRSPSRSPSPALENLGPQELHRLAREKLDQIKVLAPACALP